MKSGVGKPPNLTPSFGHSVVDLVPRSTPFDGLISGLGAAPSRCVHVRGAQLAGHGLACNGPVGLVALGSQARLRGHLQPTDGPSASSQCRQAEGVLNSKLRVADPHTRVCYARSNIYSSRLVSQARPNLDSYIFSLASRLAGSAAYICFLYILCARADGRAGVCKGRLAERIARAGHGLRTPCTQPTRT